MDTDTTVADSGTDTSGTQSGADTSSLGMASASTPADSAASSSTTPNTTSTDSSASATSVSNVASADDPTKASSQASQWDDPSNPYLKRFNDTLAHTQRLYQQKTELEKRYDGIDPARAREVMAEHEKREQALKLQPYNKGHADYGKYQAVQAKAENYRAMLANASTPEQKQAIQQAAAATFRPEEIQMIESAEQDRKQLVEQFAADPRGFLSEMMQPVIQQNIQAALNYQQQVSQAQQFISDPQISGLIQNHAEDMSWVLDQNVSQRDKAIAFAQMKAENEQLKQQMGQRMQQQATAEARQNVGVPNRPVRGNVGQNQQRISDPVKYLAEKGITSDNPKFISSLQAINNGTYKF